MKAAGVLAFTWRPDNTILVCQSAQPLERGTTSSGIRQQQSAAIHVSTRPAHCSWYGDGCVRKLLNESHRVFCRLQALWTEGAARDAKTLVDVSVNYRSVLRSVLLDLQSRPVDDLCDTLLSVYSSAELIWSLAEIVFVLPDKVGALSLDLANWARINFTSFDCLAKEIALSDGPPDDHPQFWNVVYAYVFFGRCEEARCLLATHTRVADDGGGAFGSVDELLRKAPLASLEAGEMSEWDAWRAECRRRWQRRHFVEEPQLEAVVRIVSGDQSTFDEVGMSVLSNWYEVVVPLALYSNPFVHIGNADTLLTEAMRARPPPPPTDSGGAADAALCALLELDALGALRETARLSPDWWLPAHLADLLQKAGCRDLSAGGADALDLREYFVSEYGAGLMAHSSLWQLGVDYLDVCPTSGSRAQTLLLDRLPVDSDVKALKVLRLCEQRGLSHVARSIHSQRIVDALKSRSPAAALGWALQSKDAALLSFVAERLLLDYGRSGLLASLSALEHVDPSTAASPVFFFLRKYRKFVSLMATEEGFAEASQLLVQLLVSRASPRQFWPYVLEQALPLLRSTTPYVDAEGCHRLLQVMELMDSERKLLKSTAFERPGELEENFDGSMQALRVALLQNVANALKCSRYSNK